MPSQAFEQLTLLGGELVFYTPNGKTGRTVMALIDPVRRIDTLGMQTFLTKTYDVWVVRSVSEGIMTVTAGYDTLTFKLHADDDADTTLRITKIHPERDAGLPGDSIGMWHLEAVV